MDGHMSAREGDAAYLHVYGPSHHHDSAAIVGNETALRELRHAINAALAGIDSTVRAFTNDGEGFGCLIFCTEAMERVAVPYTTDYAVEKNEDALWPVETSDGGGVLTKIRRLV